MDSSFLSDPVSSKDTPSAENTVFDELIKTWQHAMEVYAKSFENSIGLTSLAGFKDAYKTLNRLAEYWLIDPQRALKAQADFLNPFFDMWQTALAYTGRESAFGSYTPPPTMLFFTLKAWEDNPFLALMTQAVHIFEHSVEHLIAATDTFDSHTQDGARFYLKQLVSFFDPHILTALGPSFMAQTLEERGANIIRGLSMLAQDIIAGGGVLKIRHTDSKAFKVGVDLATTPGKVIFRNELIELIEYTPTTASVFQTPLLIIPPWINKYYILDLTPEKSFISWMVAQGIHVFCIVWVNPNEHHAHITFNDYRTLGISAALDVIEGVTGQQEIATLGHCIGGTLLSMDLALRAKTGDNRIVHATLLTTQIDFSHAGELHVFAEGDYLEALEASMYKKGYLDDSTLAFIFNALRPNDLIWPYIINVYLLGKSPKPFDILYWNSDTTRIPAHVHSFYLRQCYGDNAFAKGSLILGGAEADPRQITIPIYSLAAIDDHIAPAYSICLGLQYVKGPVTFVTSTSGHIAGVINPPNRHKYAYYATDMLPSTPPSSREDFQHWLKSIPCREGSWWPHWLAWYKCRSPLQIEATAAVERSRTILGDAPGTYVHVRYTDS